jgi:hypothetical protein
MNLLVRTPAMAARVFNLFVMIFLAHLCFTILIFATHSLPLLHLAVLPLYLLIIVVFFCVFALLAYQIGYHPVVAVLLTFCLFIPLVNFVLFLVLLIQAKTYLRKQNFKIILRGARPLTEQEIAQKMVPASA